MITAFSFFNPGSFPLSQEEEGVLVPVTYPTTSGDFENNIPLGGWGGNGGQGLSDLILDSGVAGTYQAEYLSTLNYVGVIGLDPVYDNSDFMSYNYGFGVSGDGFYAHLERGTIVVTAIAVMVGDIFRFRRNVGGTIIGEKNSGSGWELVHTFSPVSTARLHLKAMAGQPGSFVSNPQASNVTTYTP